MQEFQDGTVTEVQERRQLLKTGADFMMNYEIFKDVVTEKFLSYMPKEYQDMQVRVVPVEKVNRKLDGLDLRRQDGAGMVSPTIYINNIYEEYLRTGDLEKSLQNAADALDRVFRERPMPPLDLRGAKDNMIFELVNTMQNENMLKNMPHREYQDLSIIYRWVVGADDKGISSVVIHNGLAKELGMDEEQLFRAAMVNTRRILPPTVKSMNEVIRDMLLADGLPPGVADLMVGETQPKETLWIISNDYGTRGAASMLYEEKLHGLAEDLESDLYVMPSSVHEVIAVSVEMGKPEELAGMVAEINMNEVALEDRLSNQVYHYDKDLRKITLATDTPNKRLDGVVAERGMVYEAGQSR